MKKFKNSFIVAVLALLPVLVNAQWNAVRFDQVNTFHNVHAATANDAFLLGNEPTNNEGFMMRTADGGVTWDSIALNTASDTFQLTELYFTDANNGFVGGRKNNATQVLMKSTDAGTTWADITPDPVSTYTISGLFFLNPLHGFATTFNKLYTTTNGGTSWASSALTFMPYDINFISANVGFASGTYGGNVACVMKTVDGGLTWTSSLDVLDQNFFVSKCELLNIVDASTIFTTMQGTNRVYRTLDAGATWDTIVCDSVMGIMDFHFGSGTSGQVLSTFGQLYKTKDAGATWNLEYATAWGLYGPSIYLNSLAFADGVGYVCGTSGLIKRYDIETSVVDNNKLQAEAMKVFPNPCYATQNLSIATKGMTGDCSLMILNSLGKVVFSEKVNRAENIEVISVPVLSLAAGIYSVILSGEKQKQSARIVIAE